MENSKNYKTYRKNHLTVFRQIFGLFFALTIIAGFLVLFDGVSAQNTITVPTAAPSAFRVGERLTYNVSLDKFKNAGYAEIYVVSRGKLADRDAVELSSKIKTNDLVSAAFYFLDQARTTFAASESGLPLYVRKTENGSVLPNETINNYLLAPTVNYDLLTLIYQARNTGGNGTFAMQENEKIYSVNLQSGVSEKIRTDVGEFDTIASTVQSEYLTEKGLTDARINFSTDDQKIPVLFRFKTAKGEFRATLASIQNLDGGAVVTPTPIVIQTPLRPTATPAPIVTPTPYIENQPLLSELPFVLGETLDYQFTSAGQNIGTVRLQAKERKKINGQDSLLIDAVVTNVPSGNRPFALNDGIKANINPDTLAPQQIELKFNGALNTLNQAVRFDQRSGAAFLNGVNKIDVPVGTHSLLSLIYAIRSFNLKPSKDPSNPVNDTRVSVFWDKQPYVFTLRPSTGDILNLRGEKVSAQQISVNTGNPQLDALGLRLWLSNDDKRTPLRLTIGSFQADLIAESKIPPR